MWVRYASMKYALMELGLRSHCMTSSGVYEAIKEPKENIYLVVFENAGPKSEVQIWVRCAIRIAVKRRNSLKTDLKATALLKLIYLEMFGHDMSWASFNVLEVMSSQKYIQKRVGYLGAVQSFRPDTEVLMLATNLLKKVNTVDSQDRGQSDD